MMQVLAWDSCSELPVAHLLYQLDRRVGLVDLDSCSPELEGPRSYETLGFLVHQIDVRYLLYDVDSKDLAEEIDESRVMVV